MKTRTLQVIVGFTIVIAHFSALICLGVFTVLDRFTLPEALQLSAVLIPLFASFSTIIIREFLRETVEKSNSVSSKPKVIISIFIPCLFSIFILGSIVWKAFGTLSHDELIAVIGVTETAFGIYIGMIVKAIFQTDTI